ncbi:MAG: lysophospholipid acyltransferase family protein [Nitrospiria bacterium]
MKDRIEYNVVRLLIGFFQFFPYRLSTRLGVLLGSAYYLVDRRHREIALKNLRDAFKEEKSEREVNQIALASFQNMGRSIVEFACLPKWTDAQVREGVKIEGHEHILAAQKQGRGMILLSAHFGNWEWMALGLAARGIPMHVVARRMDNPYFDQMLQEWRGRFGNAIFSKQQTPAAEIVALLRKKGTVGFLLDQNTARDEAVFVDYFGRKAATHKGLAVLALRTGAPVVPVFFVRTKDGPRIMVEKALELTRSGMLKRDVFDATARFTRKIESVVRRYPDHWLWVHRRWKTPPPHPSLIRAGIQVNTGHAPQTGAER